MLSNPADFLLRSFRTMDFNLEGVQKKSGSSSKLGLRAEFLSLKFVKVMLFVISISNSVLSVLTLWSIILYKWSLSVCLVSLLFIFSKCCPRIVAMFLSSSMMKLPSMSVLVMSGSRPASVIKYLWFGGMTSL